MKSSTRVWNSRIPGVSLDTYVNELIKDEHTIISIIPTSYDIDPFSKLFNLSGSGHVGYKVTEAIILMSDNV